jgi:hypothetical protein
MKLKYMYASGANKITSKIASTIIIFRSKMYAKVVFLAECFAVPATKQKKGATEATPFCLRN